MRVCLMIEGQEGVSWKQWLALADACKQHGIETLFRSDHYLNLDGVLNVTESAGGTFGPGVYRLIDYTGLMVNNVLVEAVFVFADCLIPATSSAA